jgi:hypothetical protein
MGRKFRERGSLAMATHASNAADLLERLMAAPIEDRALVLNDTGTPAAHLAKLI